MLKLTKQPVVTTFKERFSLEIEIKFKMTKFVDFFTSIFRNLRFPSLVLNEI